MAMKTKSAKSRKTLVMNGQGETIAGYFRKIFEEKPRLLSKRSNNELYKRLAARSSRRHGGTRASQAGTVEPQEFDAGQEGQEDQGSGDAEGHRAPGRAFPACSSKSWKAASTTASPWPTPWGRMG